MNKRKKIDMSKLCLKSKPSKGAPNQISQFFATNEPSTSTSTAISRPLLESINIHPIQPVESTISTALKAYEHTKDRMTRLAKRKSNLSPLPIAKFFDPVPNNTSMADFESPKRIKAIVKKPIAQTKPVKRPTRQNRAKQNSIKNLLPQTKTTEENLFSELLAQQCASENVHPDELQMALALSKSLVESFSQEGDVNNDSGNSKLAATAFSDIQKTLESFGFKSSTTGLYSANDMKTILRVGKNSKWRRKFSKHNLDFIRKSFDEKLSIIFTENDIRKEFELNTEYTLSSEMLRELRVPAEDTFYRIQSSDVHSSKLVDRYYSPDIFQKSTVARDFLLKNWDEIPGRTPSPIRRQTFDLSKITEMSEKLSQNTIDYRELEPQTNVISEETFDIPAPNRTLSRDIKSPDLFSDSDVEPDDSSASPPKSRRIVPAESETGNSGITHFENYTSEEAKIKDVELNESNTDIFADLSIDMIDLTSECGSCEPDNPMSPSVLKKPSQQLKSVNENVERDIPEDSVFTLSSETCMSECVRSEATKDSVEIPIETEPDSIGSYNTGPLNLQSLNHIDHEDVNDAELPASDQFNTENITLVYSDDEERTDDIEPQTDDANVSSSIVILSDSDSDDESPTTESSTIISRTKPKHHNSVLSFIELPHFLEYTKIDQPTDTEAFPSALTQNMPSVCYTDAVITQLSDKSDSFETRENALNLNRSENVSLSPSSNANNDTQNIILAFSEDGDHKENSSSNREPSTPLSDDPNIHLSNGFKTPPRQNSMLDLSAIHLPNFNNHSEFLHNITQNISDSIEISDDEVNYSTAQLNPMTPMKTPEKSIEIDSDDESNLLGKSMHSFLQRYEKSISEEINTIEDGTDETNEVNKSVNEFLFKSRIESTDRRSNLSSAKSLFKRHPSEPSFTRTESRTPKKLCFDQLKLDDEFDQLVFGAKSNHDVILPSESPLREIPNSPEPLLENNLNELDCPFNYFQPDDEYDIVLNQNTPKSNLNGTIDLNETVYEGEKYIYKTRNVTPEPDYNNMDISMLHAELKRFGLKKISRPKAIKLLEYIYNETHPIIEDTDKATIADSDHHQISSSQPVKQSNRSPAKRPELAATQVMGTWSGIDFCACDDNVDYFKTDNFTLNLLNSNEMVYLPSKPRSGKIHYCSLALHIAFYNLFRANAKLRHAIFMYQPIEVEKIFLYFKSIGAKYEMNDLISFLDRHCITFRTEPKSKATETRSRK